MKSAHPQAVPGPDMNTAMRGFLDNQLQCIGSFPWCSFHSEYKAATHVRVAGKALLTLLVVFRYLVVMMVLHNQNESATLLLIISGWLDMPDSIFLQNNQKAVKKSLALKKSTFLLKKE